MLEITNVLMRQPAKITELLFNDGEKTIFKEYVNSDLFEICCSCSNNNNNCAECNHMKECKKFMEEYKKN